MPKADRQKAWKDYLAKSKQDKEFQAWVAESLRETNLAIEARCLEREQRRRECEESNDDETQTRKVLCNICARDFTLEDFEKTRNWKSEAGLKQHHDGDFHLPMTKADRLLDSLLCRPKKHLGDNRLWCHLGCEGPYPSTQDMVVHLLGHGRHLFSRREWGVLVEAWRFYEQEDSDDDSNVATQAPSQNPEMTYCIAGTVVSVRVERE